MASALILVGLAVTLAKPVCHMVEHPYIPPKYRRKRTIRHDWW